MGDGAEVGRSWLVGVVVAEGILRGEVERVRSRGRNRALRTSARWIRGEVEGGRNGLEVESRR